MRKRINKILWHGDELFEEKAKAPGIATSADGLDGLNEGEIYISNNEKDPALFIRTSSGKVVRVGVNYEELKKLFLSKTDDDTAEGLINFEKGVRIKNLILKVENDVLSLTNIENGKRAHFAASGTVSSLGVGSTGGGGGSSEGGASALYQLLDVLSDGTKVEGAEDGSVLTYDENAGKWKATKIDIPEADLTEIEGQLASIGQLITALQGKDTEHSNAITALQQKDGEIEAAIGSNAKGIESLQGQLDTLVSGDASDAIDTFNEVVAFLKDIEDTDTLEGILAGKQNKIDANNKLDYSLLANTPSLADFMGGSAIGGTASSDNFSAVYWDGKQWQTRTIYKWALASAKPSYTTSEVTEGTRLYFTDDRAKTALKSTTDALSDRIAKFEKMFQWGNGDGSYVKTPFSFASDKTVSSLGVGSDEGGGVSYDRLDSWDTYSADKAGYVLSAALGWDLKDRLDNLDLGDFDLSGYLTKSEAQNTYATIESLNSYATKTWVSDNYINKDTSSIYIQKFENNVFKGGLLLGSTRVVGLSPYESEAWVLDNTAGNATFNGHVTIKNGLICYDGSNLYARIHKSSSAFANDLSVFDGDTDTGFLRVSLNKDEIATYTGYGSTKTSYIKVSSGEASFKSLKVNDVVIGSLAFKNNLVASDIPSLSWNKITSDKPTTLAGYGITDGVWANAIDLSNAAWAVSGLQDWADSNPSFIGSFYDKTAWYNVISIRHRNGASDGNKYGMLLYSLMTGEGSLKYVQNYGGSWDGTARTILDSSNFSDYALPLTGGEISGNLTVGEWLAVQDVIYAHKGLEVSKTIKGIAENDDETWSINGDTGAALFDSIKIGSSPSIYKADNNALVVAKSGVTYKTSTKGNTLQVISQGAVGIDWSTAIIAYGGEAYNVVGSGVGLSLGGYVKGSYANAPIGRGVGIAAVSESTWYNVTGLAFFTNSGTSDSADHFTEKLRLTAYGSLIPKCNTSQVLGNSDNRWSYVYSANGDFSGSVTIGDAKIWWDATNKVLRTNVSFASDKTVSSLGVGSESGGGGTGGYASLDNVASDVLPSASNTFTIGNFSRLWKAVYANSLYLGTTNVGESISSLQSALSTANGNIGTLNTRVTNIEGGYAKKATTLAGYGITDALPLSGGTMSGALTIKNASPGIILHRDSGAPYIRFTGGADNTNYGELGVASYGDLVFWDSLRTSPSWKTIIHSGNIGSQSVNYATSAGNASTLNGLDSTYMFRLLGTNGNLNFEDHSSKNGVIFIHSGLENYHSDSPFSYGSVLSINIDVSSWMLATNNGSDLFYRNRWWSGGGGNWTSWKKIAFTDSNVASAQSLIHSNGTLGATVADNGRVEVSAWGLLINKNAPSESIIGITGYIGPAAFDSDSMYISNAHGVVMSAGSSTKSIAVNSNGNVLIGTTTDSGFKLYVAGDIYTPSGMNSQYIELNSKGELQGYGGFIDFHFNGSSAGYTSRIIEKVSGKISIVGNAEVEGALSATGNISAQGNITTSNGSFVGNLSGNASSANRLITSSGASFAFHGSAYTEFGLIAWEHYVDGSKVIFRNPNSQTMLINSSGNVTIGSSDLAGTSNKLHVEGAIYTPSGISSKYIELNSKGELQGYGGFIDFHFNGSTGDYTCRIIEDGRNSLLINSSYLRLAGATTIGSQQDLAGSTYKLYVNGNSYVNGIFNVANVIEANKGINIYGSLTGYVSGTDSDTWSITNQGAATFSDTLTVQGKAELQSGIDVIGLIQGLDSVGGDTTWKITSDGSATVKNIKVGGNERIHGRGNNFYIGNASNAGWVGMQDICSQDALGDSKWSIRTDGRASFGSTLKVAGATTLSSTLGVTGVATFNSKIKAKGYIYFGANDEAWIYWDAGKKVLRTNVSFASDKTVSSLGVGSESGGGGSVDWSAVPTNVIPASNGEYTLGSNSKMWRAFYAQQGFMGGILATTSGITISALMAGSGSTWQIATNGAASFSSLSVGGSAINFGNFATTSQLNSYVTLKSQQTIEGAKTFQNGLNFYGELKGYDAESGGDNIVLNASDGSVNLSTLTAGTAIYTGEKTAAWDGKSGAAIMASGSMVLCAAAPRIYFAYGNAASSAGVASLEAMSGSGLNFKYNMQVFTESESYANFIGLNFKNTRIFRLNNSSSGMQFQYGTSTSNVSTKGTFSTSGAYSASSDITKKNILSYNAGFNVHNIAEAPIAYFTWKDLTDNRVNLGSIAQYWQLIAPECIYGTEGIDMTMDYSTLGLVSSIINARAIVSHENEIDKLKKRVEELESENKRLQERVDALVA